MTEAVADTEARVALVVRLPKRVHQALRAIAYREERSLNSIIVQYTQQGVEHTQAKEPLPAGDARAAPLADVA